MRLFAVIVTEETEVPETQSLDGLDKARVKMERLEQAVEDSYRDIQQSLQAHPAISWQAVFLAPEYYFSKQREVNDRFFSQNIKQWVLHRLVALARKYPKFLIIPGTVLWTKKAFNTTKTVTSTGMDQEKHTVNANRVAKAKTRIQNAAPFGTETKEKGWAYQNNSSFTSTPEKMLDKADLMETRIAQNVAYVCLGDQVIKYHKVGNYQEVRGEQGNIVFVPGNIVGRFSVGGVKYGLEICMDHALGVLESTINNPTDKVHIALIVSSYVANKGSTNAAVTLHSSTMQQQMYVDSDTNNATTTGTAPVRFEGGGTGRLALGLTHNPIRKANYTIWVIDLDDNKLGIGNVSSYHLGGTNLSSIGDKYFQ
jgi:hypothetical protein